MDSPTACSRSPRRVGAALAAAVALILLAAGCTGTAPAPAPPDGEQAPNPTAPTSTAEVVERLAPSVVTVQVGAGSGSGVVYRDDVIVTNAHVVGNTRDVVVNYADGTSSGGRVLATDTVTDLAVVRTERAGLPVPEYHTELPRPGDPVLAIGSPLGFEGTVTAGIISGLNREIPGSAAQGARSLVDLIQTDAAISPGNSGGALLDATGRVIGVNEAYLPPETGAVAIGFAIPAATVVDIADQLLADGTATHPALGVQLARLTPSIREQLGVQAPNGTLVAAVEPGGPAAEAGVRPGDVIVGVAGQQVDSIESVLGALRSTAPGEQSELEVVRGGQRMTVPITVGAANG